MGLRIQVYVQAGARTQVQMPYILACVQEWDILVGVQERGISWACVQEQDILASVQGRDIMTGVQERDTLSCAQERDILACLKERDVLAGVQERDILTGTPPDWRYCQISSIIVDYREQSVLIEWGRVGLRIQVYVQAGARTQVQMPYILACVQEWDILVGVQECGISWRVCKSRISWRVCRGGIS